MDYIPLNLQSSYPLPSRHGYKLITKIDQLVNGASKWDNYSAWVQSKQRQQFYNIVDKIQQRKNKTSQQLASPPFQNISQPSQSSSKNSVIKHQQDTTLETIQPQSNTNIEEQNEIKRKSLQIQKQLFGKVPLSIVCLRRKVLKLFNLITFENRKYYEVKNLSQLSYFMFFDMFKKMNFEAFCSYKQFILLTDLSWINQNKTLPKGYRFLTEDTLKKFVVDYYVLVEKYSTKQVLENYDLEFVLDVYFRSVMVAKGCKNEELKDFGKEISVEDWIDHHERSCGIKGKWKGNQRDGELELDMQGFQVVIKKRNGKFLVAYEN